MPLPEFPEGILRPDDEGGSTVMVTIQGDAVVMAFKKPMLWIAFEPEYLDVLIEKLQKHKSILLERRAQRKHQ
jgi:hypothetical protein